MTSLKNLQETFQRAVVEGDDEVLSAIVDSPKEKRDVLLGVYRNAYVWRLVDIVAEDYERLHQFLGDDQFHQMASRYIAACPSSTPNARWVGARLPEYLGGHEPYSKMPVLRELAAFERLLNDVFDAEDAPALAQDDLAGIPPQDWASLVFVPHPATLRLDLATNALDIWQALKADESPPAPAKLDATEHVLAWRPEYSSTFRPMQYDEAMMWDEMANGACFGDLCALLAFAGSEDEAAVRAAGYLQGWISSRLLGKMPD